MYYDRSGRGNLTFVAIKDISSQLTCNKPLPRKVYQPGVYSIRKGKLNCSDFQKILMQEPACTKPGFLQHAKDCRTCREKYERALEFEARLLDAMEVDVPDELAERVLHSLGKEREHGIAVAKYGWGALAAGFLLLVTLAGWMGFDRGGGTAYAENLPQVVSQHIEKERHHLQSQERLGEAEVAQLFARFGAVMHAGMGKVVFAEACWIRHQHGLHLILSEAHGPVTLLFMPGEYVARRQDLQFAKSSGLLLPAVYGSLAIVAPSHEMAAQVQRRVDGALMWGG